MSKINELLSGIIAEKASSRTVVMITTIIIVFGTPILMYGLWNKPYYETVFNLRVIHWCIGAVVFLSLLFCKKTWNNFYGSISYTLMFMPVFFIGWYNHEALVASNELGKPYGGFPVVFMMLAVLVPYSYVLNLILISVFTIETALIWYILDLGNNPNVISNGEPFYTFIFAFVSFCLLILRYRLDVKIHTLVEQKTRSEFIENIARTFLSIRDRTNTPLQSLLILSESVKKGRKLSEDEIQVFNNSVHSLINLNKKLVRYESQIQWGKRDLMTDQEIETWLEKIEHEAGKEKT